MGLISDAEMRAKRDAILREIKGGRARGRARRSRWNQVHSHHLAHVVVTALSTTSRRAPGEIRGSLLARRGGAGRGVGGPLHRGISRASSSREGAAVRRRRRGGFVVCRRDLASRAPGRVAPTYWETRGRGATHCQTMSLASAPTEQK